MRPIRHSLSHCACIIASMLLGSSMVHATEECYRLRQTSCCEEIAQFTIDCNGTICEGEIIVNSVYFDLKLQSPGFKNQSLSVAASVPCEFFPPVCAGGGPNNPPAT